MSTQLERDRLIQCAGIGTSFEVGLPLGGVDFFARILPVDEVEQTIKGFPEATSSLFTTDEVLHSMAFRVRTFEHFAARLGAKQIILGLLRDGIGGQDVSVANNNYNAPHFVFSELAQELLNRRRFEAVHLSISHEGNVAVAFGAIEREYEPWSIGIAAIGTDVCTIEPFQKPIARKTTFNEREIEQAEAQEDPAKRYAMYYAAKESVIKVLETRWVFNEIEVNETSDNQFHINVSGSARERLNQMGAVEIVPSLSYIEGIGALAFSVALMPSLDMP